MMWTHYLRCDECGVDAGKACRDEHDREALEVCDGRVLRINDSAHRTRNSRRDEIVPDAVRRSRGHRTHVAPIAYAPCDFCGVSTRLWGAAHVTGKTWCTAPGCQAAKKRAQWARDRASRRARDRADAPPPQITPCPVCDTPTAHTYCTSTCRETAKSRRKRLPDAEKKKLQHDA